MQKSLSKSYGTIETWRRKIEKATQVMQAHIVSGKQREGGCATCTALKSAMTARLRKRNALQHKEKELMDNIMYEWVQCGAATCTASKSRQDTMAKRGEDGDNKDDNYAKPQACLWP